MAPINWMATDDFGIISSHSYTYLWLELSINKLISDISTAQSTTQASKLPKGVSLLHLRPVHLSMPSCHRLYAPEWSPQTFRHLQSPLRRNDKRRRLGLVCFYRRNLNRSSSHPSDRNCTISIAIASEISSRVSFTTILY